MYYNLEARSKCYKTVLNMLISRELEIYLFKYQNTNEGVSLLAQNCWLRHDLKYEQYFQKFWLEQISSIFEDEKVL